MARDDRLPPPLPPETRTIGQLVAEAVQAYRRRPLGALAIGVPVAVADFVGTRLDPELRFVLSPGVGALLVTPAYIGGVLLVHGIRPPSRTILTAYAAGAFVFVPFPLLAAFYILPGVAWFALLGLCVPVALLEGRSVSGSIARAYRLGLADYVHALGGMATLAIVVFLTRTVLFFLLRDFGDSTIVAAAVLADLVISPLLFLGAAILYDDQRARVVDSGPPEPTRRSDADVHPAVEPDRPGSADAEVESGTSARGEP